MAPRNPQDISLTRVFTTFAMIGTALFGGGYAMLPLMERELVQRRRWLSSEAVADIFALSQVIPGVIAVNSSMLVGQRLRGWAGAMVAALGTITAPFMVILLLANAFDTLMGNVWVERFVQGLRPAVAGLLLGTALRLIWRSWRDWGHMAIGAAAAGAAALLALNPAWIILAGISGALLTQGAAAWRQRPEAGQ